MTKFKKEVFSYNHLSFSLLLAKIFRKSNQLIKKMKEIYSDEYSTKIDKNEAKKLEKTLVSLELLFRKIENKNEYKNRGSNDS